MANPIRFLSDVKSELTKVVWPSRKDVLRFSTAVIVVSVGTALILGAADYGLLKGIEALLK